MALSTCLNHNAPAGTAAMTQPRCDRLYVVYGKHLIFVGIPEHELATFIEDVVRTDGYVAIATTDEHFARLERGREDAVDGLV